MECVIFANVGLPLRRFDDVWATPSSPGRKSGMRGFPLRPNGCIQIEEWGLSGLCRILRILT